MSTGTLQPPDTAPPAGTPPGAITVCARGWRAAWTSQQAGLARFNCADSLDRTNAASYFAGVQALAEAVGRLGLDAGPRGAGGGGPARPAVAPSPALPPGWEARSLPDGRTFFLDHNTRTTAWAPQN